MSLINDLYSEVILEHYKNPRNHEPIADADATERGYNESCGDDIRVYVKLKEDRIEEVSFTGRGCAISQSSASMMTDLLQGKTIGEAIAAIDSFKSMISGQSEFPGDGEFEELSALKGVVKLPVRIKCATLSWNTVRMALGKLKQQN